MALNSYDTIIRDSVNIAAAGDDASPTGMQFLDNLLYPNLQQQKEFGQQVALQQMQNDWSVAGKMEAGKKAGINPNLLAEGIAGASSSSVGSPNSAVGAGAQGFGAAAQMAGAANEAVNAGVNAYEKLALTSTENERRKAEISNLLASAFHNQWLGRAVAEMLPLQKDNERADTWLKLANFDKAREEKKLINKRISEADAHINQMNKQADLFEQQGNLAKAEKLRVDAQATQIQLQNDKLQWDKDFREKWHFDNTKPIDNAMIEAMSFEDGDALGAVGSIGKAIETVAESERKGFNMAEIEDGYIKAYNELKAKADIDAEFAPYFAMIEANKHSVIEFIKAITDNPNDIQGIIGKLANLMSMFGLAGQIDKGVVNTAKKPNAGVTITNR